MSTGMRSTLDAILTRVAGSDRVGDLRLRRTLLFMLAAFSSVAGVVWGSLYLALGERNSGRSAKRWWIGWARRRR